MSVRRAQRRFAGTRNFMYGQDFTSDEIADRLQCSERTIRRFMKRVQERLSQMLEASTSLVE